MGMKQTIKAAAIADLSATIATYEASIRDATGEAFEGRLDYVTSPEAISRLRRKATMARIELAALRVM